LHRAPDAPGQRVPNETIVRRLRALQPSATKEGDAECTTGRGALEQTGAPVEDVVPLGVYVTDIADAEIGRTGR
jgi:hypothetical protein